MKRLITLLALSSLLLTSACAVGEGPMDGDLIGSSSSASSVRPTFDLWQSESGDYYFHLDAANGETLLSSEGYQNRMGAINGILSVLNNGGLDFRYEVFEGADAQWYLNLRAGNGQVIATGQGYSTKSNATRAVGSNVNAIASYLEHWDAPSGARFQVFEGKDGQYYFNLHAHNGAVMLSSEGYTTEAAALNGAFSVAENGVFEDAYVVEQATDGGYYLNLRAGNNQIIGTSEVYDNKANALRARDSIVNLIPEADLL